MNRNKVFFSSIVIFFSLVGIVFSNNPSILFSPSKKPTPTIEQDQSLNQETQGVSVSQIPDISQEISVIPQTSFEQTVEGHRVVKVVDGDTIDVDIDGRTERLRLIGIDTPETVDPRKPVQCYGREASNKAKEILTGQFVTLESDPTQGERDKYKRLLRYVILADGTNFNLFMIAEGYAHEYTYHLPYKYQADFKQAEVDARNGNKGLWSPNTCSGNK